MTLKTVEWKNNSVIMIDQTKLPGILEYVTYTDYNEVANAIRTLVVRGAPAIGVSGAFGLALAVLQSSAKEKGASCVQLDIRETQEAAIQLFKSKGYEQWGSNPSYAVVEGKTISGLYFYKNIK